MARFYFHKHQDGKQIEDHKGRSFPDEQAGCRHAFSVVAAIIGRTGRIDDHARTYIGIEVNDGEQRDASSELLLSSNIPAEAAKLRRHRHL
jgi:hypothetical protein